MPVTVWLNLDKQDSILNDYLFELEVWEGICDAWENIGLLFNIKLTSSGFRIGIWLCKGLNLFKVRMIKGWHF